VRTVNPRDPAVTSRMMAAVRNKNSKAEVALRRELHARGVRYRLHARDVPGHPDIVIRSLRLAVFVDGDMWHGNAWRLRGLARLEDLFPTRTEWWAAKISRNMERDRQVSERLKEQGWSVVRLWESDVQRSARKAADFVESAIGRCRKSAAPAEPNGRTTGRARRSA
jgi:DNA mismatch endonuclease (patch repair protein)